MLYSMQKTEGHLWTTFFDHQWDVVYTTQYAINKTIVGTLILYKTQYAINNTIVETFVHMWVQLSEAINPVNETVLGSFVSKL